MTSEAVLQVSDIPSLDLPNTPRVARPMIRLMGAFSRLGRSFGACAASKLEAIRKLACSAFTGRPYLSQSYFRRISRPVLSYDA